MATALRNTVRGFRRIAVYSCRECRTIDRRECNYQSRTDQCVADRTGADANVSFPLIWRGDGFRIERVVGSSVRARTEHPWVIRSSAGRSRRRLRHAVMVGLLAGCSDDSTKLDVVGRPASSAACHLERGWQAAPRMPRPPGDHHCSGSFSDGADSDRSRGPYVENSAQIRSGAGADRRQTPRPRARPPVQEITSTPLNMPMLRGI